MARLIKNKLNKYLSGSKLSFYLIVLPVCAIAMYLVIAYVVPIYVDSKRNAVYADSVVVDQKSEILHNTLLVADLHADSLLWNRNLKYKHNYGHIDVPRLKQGNIGLQVFSVVTKTPRGLNLFKNDDSSDNITLLAIAQRWPRATWHSLLERALYQSKKLQKLTDDDELMIIKNRADINYLIAARDNDNQMIGGVLSLEGAHALEGKLENVVLLFKNGFRIIGFTHFFDNELGGSVHGMNKGGITEFGKRVLRKSEELGIIIDVSHASSSLLDDILELSTKPVIATHTGVEAICKTSPRNLTDAQIIKIARSGGIIGIGLWPAAICSYDISGFIKSVIHVVSLVSIDHVALGSDFDGNVQVPFDVSNQSKITNELLLAGFTEQEIRKIMGQNVINLLKKTLPDSYKSD